MGLSKIFTPLLITKLVMCESKVTELIFIGTFQNELKRKTNPISNVCLGGCAITSKAKINIS